MFDNIQIYSSIALAVFTFGLLIATFYYAKKTAEMAEEMKVSRVPYIAAFLRPLGPTNWRLAVGNLGKGVAKNVALKIETQPRGRTRSYTYKYVLAGQIFYYPTVVIPNPDYPEDPSKDEWVMEMGTLSSENYRIIVTGHYSSLYGERFSINEKIEIATITEELRFAHQIYMYEDEYHSHVTILKEIQKTLEDMRRDIRNLSKNRGL